MWMEIDVDMQPWPVELHNAKFVRHPIARHNHDPNPTDSFSKGVIGAANPCILGLLQCLLWGPIKMHPSEK
jgi:hypothetical protein